MTTRRNTNAWIWVAITAIALASVARAQSGFELARAYATPVIALLSADHPAQARSASHVIQQWPTQAARTRSFQNADSGLWLDMLPVLFVGLLLPLSLLSPRSTLWIGRAIPAPVLPALFQRPPPAQIL